MNHVDEACKRLDRPALTPIVEELARRLDEGRGTPTRITLRGLHDDHRSALADLLGTAKLPPADTSLEVARLLSALRLSDAAELRQVIEQLHGPLANRAADRAAQRDARAALWDWFTVQCQMTLVANVGPLREWPTQVRKEGIRGDLTAHRARLTRVFDVLTALTQVPQAGMPLATFANLTLGDSHALDHGQPLARLVVTAIADAANEPRPDTAEDARALWELVGVNPDPLSSNALSIGLAVRADHPLASILTSHSLAAEPVILTLSQIKRWPIDPLSADRCAYVVENPAIVAAAASQAWSGPPIICSSGRPSIAVVSLLRQLGANGATLQQHADFDAAGLSITAWLHSRAGTTPWLMTANAYRAAVGTQRERPQLGGVLPATPWDPELSDAMEKHGHAVYEEELTEHLLTAMVDS
ncbi:MAG: TIGR02679 family protein [Acidimicrobiia bacterium]